MPTITMTIKLIEPPSAGKARGSIVGNCGTRLGIFAETARQFEPGRTYDIEYTETPYQGRTLKNVKSAVEVFNQPAAAEPAAASNGGSYKNKDQEIFVCAMLKSFIEAGKIELDPKELAAAASMFKRFHTWAFVENREVPIDVNSFRASEANGQRAARG
jgi:hypothetical protein